MRCRDQAEQAGKRPVEILGAEPAPSFETVLTLMDQAGLVASLLVAGRAADRYGRKRVLVPGVVVAIVSAALFISADDVAALLIARFLVGVSVGVVVSAGMAAVIDVGGEHRRHVTSMVASIAMVFGAGLGPLLAGAIYQNTSHPVPWVFGVNIGLLVLALAGRLTLPLPRPTGATRGVLWPRIPTVPARNRAQVAAGIGAFAPGLTATSFVLSLGPSLLVLAVGASSPLLAGGAACLMFLAATVSQLLLTNRAVHSLFALAGASTVLAMAAIVLTVHTRSPALFVAAALLAGCGQGLGQLGGLRSIAQHVEPARRAEANAALNVGAYLPAAILTVATGFLVTGIGMPAAATTLAAALAVIAAVAGACAHRSAGRG